VPAAPPPVRVALVSDAVEHAGAEQYLALLAGALGERFALHAFLNEHATELRERLAAHGVGTTTIPGLVRLPRPGPVVALARALRRHRPDLVHVNLTDQGDGRGLLAAAWASRLPTVATLHNAIPGRVRWREQLSAMALRLPHAVVSVSEEVGGYVRRIRASTTVVENGIEEVPLHPDPRAVLGLPRDAVVVGGIGRLHVQKGWDVLCAAAPAIVERVPGVVLAVVGEGRERDDLLARPGAEHVRFLGYHEGASSLVGAFDLLVVPSRFEAFGLVAVEAMLAEVPVVASATGGLVDVVGDTGVLVPPEDPAALADAVVALATDADRRADLGRRGRARALARFGVERMARETAAAYDAVLRRRTEAAGT